MTVEKSRLHSLTGSECNRLISAIITLAGGLCFVIGSEKENGRGKSQPFLSATHEDYSAIAVPLPKAVVIWVAFLRSSSVSKQDISTSSRIQEQIPSQPNPSMETTDNFEVVNAEPAASRQAVGNVRKPTKIADPRPTDYKSLPTGTRIEEDIGTGGHGELDVDNGTSEDAVVRLCDEATDQTLRWFFVQAHSSAHVARVPRGTFRLSFT